MYVSTKNYEQEFPIAYRQWRADTACAYIHGYSISVYLEFESEYLDNRNWVVDFSSLRPFKEFMKDLFDHKLLVAQDDPEFKTFEDLHKRGLCKMTVVEKTGCEGISKWLYDYVNEIWLPENGYGHVHCRLVKITETPSNSAWYECRMSEHDDQMIASFTTIQSHAVSTFDEAVATIHEALDYVKRVKMEHNKANVRNEFHFMCRRFMQYAETPAQQKHIMQLCDSI